MNATGGSASPSIFSRIIAGEIPCHRVYEDDRVIAFLDIGPLSRGHLLLVPKEPTARLHDLSDESAAALGRAMPRLARALMSVTGCPAINVLLNDGSGAGQEVPHVHFHLIPRHEDGSGLRKEWRASKLDPKDGAALAESLRAAVTS